MGKDMKGFMLFTDQKEAICCLDDAEAGTLFKALYRYAADGQQPEFKVRALMSLFCMIRAQIDRSQSTYEKRCKANRANALKRQVVKLSQDKTTVTQRLQSQATVSDGVLLSDKNKDKSKKSINEEASASVINTKASNEEYSFDTIWQMYGKPVGNVVTLREKWNRLPDADKANIIQYVPQYVASRSDVQFRKNFDNFLTQRIWETEPIRNNNMKVGIVLQDNDPNKYKNDETW